MNNTVVFITALPCEYQAVAAYLTQLQEEMHPEGTLYGVGNYQNHHVHWRVAIVETGQGNPKAALETERAINHFKSTFAFFVGVAGELKMMWHWVMWWQQRWSKDMNGVKRQLKIFYRVVI
jgi:nucleoside phosphorylase